MDWIDLISRVLNILLTGGVIVAWLKYRIEHKKLMLVETEESSDRRRDDFKLALDVVTQQRDDGLSLVNECRSSLYKMEREVQGLRIARELDPFPHWILGLDGYFLYVNREFEKAFLEPSSRDYRDIIGTRPTELWPPPLLPAHPPPRRTSPESS